MHINFTLKAPNGLELPMHYNQILQAAIYNAIDPELAAFLHDRGYQSGNRKFKLFAFSRLLGRYEIDKEKHAIRFPGEIKLVVSSPILEFCQSIANGLLTRGTMRLGSSLVEVERVEVEQFKVEDEEIVVQTLSPVVVYSTLIKPDGRKYTCYFQPGEPDYDRLIENNLRKKYDSYLKQDAPPGEVKIKRLGKGEMRILSYKDTVIKGYVGKLVMTGPKELLQMAVDGGIGGKNSQGFGCVYLAGRR